MVNKYCKLRDKQQRVKQNNYKIKYNHQLTHQVETTNDRQFTKESSHTDSPKKTTKSSSTGYQPTSNKTEQVEPHIEILKLHLKQDELIKEGIKIEQNVESIKLKIKELTSKV